MTGSRLARGAAVTTLFFSVPLFLTYQIRHWNHPSYVFVALYGIGIFSVLVVPTLIVLDSVCCLVAWRRGRSGTAKWLGVGAATGILAESVFLVLRTR